MCKSGSFGMRKRMFCNALIDSRLSDRYVCEKYLHFSCLFSS